MVNDAINEDVINLECCYENGGSIKHELVDLSEGSKLVSKKQMYLIKRDPDNPTFKDAILPKTTKKHILLIILKHFRLQHAQNL